MPTVSESSRGAARRPRRRCSPHTRRARHERGEHDRRVVDLVGDLAREQRVRLVHAAAAARALGNNSFQTRGAVASSAVAGCFCAAKCASISRHTGSTRAHHPGWRGRRGSRHEGPRPRASTSCASTAGGAGAQTRRAPIKNITKQTGKSLVSPSQARGEVRRPFRRIASIFEPQHVIFVTCARIGAWTRLRAVVCAASAKRLRDAGGLEGRPAVAVRGDKHNPSIRAISCVKGSS